MAIKAIIFDMDGLLVDSEVTWFIAETEFIEARGHQYSQEVREQVIGKRIDEFMITLRDHYRLEETILDLTDELVERMMKLIPVKVQPQPGAAELMSYVYEQGIPHAIASSSPMPIIDATLKSQGWDNLFEVRCTADDETFGKPAPDVYLTAAKRLGFAPEDCLALEDSPNGARAAVAAGMTCYAVPDTSHSQVEAFTNITPHVFGSLHEVLAHIRQNGLIHRGMVQS